MSDHSAISDLLPGYALGCLDTDDERAVSAHLPRCAPCRIELESYARVADLLTATVPAAEPPAGLPLRIARGLRARQQHRIRSWRPALGAMAALFVAALIAGNLLQYAGVIHRPGEARSSALLTATLAGTGEAVGAYGTVVLDPADREGVLAVTGLPRLDSVHQYQVWLIRGAERRSAGVFSVDAQGYGSLLLSVPIDFRDFGALGVSIEPTGGSVAPTGARVMAGAL
jgi:anti-sigma-K factor RskA